MICKHCHERRANRPRGLCWSCYNTPGVREQYACLSLLGRPPVEDFAGQEDLPSQPTNARPGSPEKVAVLQERARLKQRLWHPLDAPYDGRPNLRVLAALQNLWSNDGRRRRKKPATAVTKPDGGNG